MFDSIWWLIISLCIAIFVQGYGGFGMGIISMSLFAFGGLDLERAAVVSTICGIVVTFELMRVSSRHKKPAWRQVFLLFIGILVGQPIGYWLLDRYGAQPIFLLFFGIILLWFSVQGFIGKFKLQLPLWTSLPLGLLSGFLTGAFTSGGPPLILYLYAQVKDAREMKATVQALFLIASIYRLILVGFSEKGIDTIVLGQSAICLLGMLPCLYLAHWLSHKSSHLLFTRIVYVMLGISGILMMSNYWFSAS